MRFTTITRADDTQHRPTGIVLVVAASVGLQVFAAALTYAFGPTGHRVVGQIAANHLSPKAKEGVRDLLDPESLAQVATWPDEIRSDPDWDESAPWHYVNIEDGKTYELRDREPNEDPRDVVEAIEHFTAVLRQNKADKKDLVVAMKWVVHLVGDIHQPLHVGRAGDRGGNTIDTTWFGEETKLHAVWDSGLIDSTRLSYKELAEFIDTATPAQINDWQDSNVITWLEESLDLRSAAYQLPESTIKGSYRYSYEKLPIVKRRLVQAGVRLAGVLNRIFADAGEFVWDQMPDSLHWVRNSAEYEALVRQVYRHAKKRLRKLKKAGQLPPGWAVALDADETVIDNSQHEKEQRGRPFNLESWTEWCRREEAKAIPGVVKFLKTVRNLGGKIAIVSNRNVNVQRATESNFRKRGILYDVILLEKGNREKEPRWRMIEGGDTPAGLPPLEIIMYFGDNIKDFPILDQSSWLESRNEFGRRYFVLPNPVYGSFEDNPRK